MLGEAMYNVEMENRVEIGNNTDESSSMQLGKNTRNFSLYPQIGLREGIDRFVDLIPQLPSPLMNTFLAERYSSIDNQEKLTSLGPFGCPSDYTKTGITSNLTEVRSSFVHNFEGLPFDMNGRLELSKFITPQELDGRVVGHVNEWGMIEQMGLNSTRFSNELSLSLATSQCSEMNSLHNRPMVSERTPCNSSSSYKPLQAPPLLSGSSFVQAMQEILSEIACYALENIDHGVNVPFGEDHTFMFQNKLLLEGDIEAKKKHLISLLQLVDDRYNQCVDEIHTVTSAFHAVTELDPNLHARFALPTISFMYKNLRERISNHILAIRADGETREEKSFETCFLQKQWALQQLSKRDHQFWRPQRGLPEQSVSVLRAWMFQNFLHPYPKDAEKHLLALKSGLTRNQVSNWFINARVRLWKPMIEEMCAEMNKRKARRINEETEGDYRSHMCFDTRRFTMEKHG